MKNNNLTVQFKFATSNRYYYFSIIFLIGISIGSLYFSVFIFYNAATMFHKYFCAPALALSIPIVVYAFIKENRRMYIEINRIGINIYRGNDKKYSAWNKLKKVETFKGWLNTGLYVETEEWDVHLKLLHFKKDELKKALNLILQYSLEKNIDIIDELRWSDEDKKYVEKGGR